MRRKMAREPNTNAEDTPSPAPAAPSKINLVLELLRREHGATLPDLVEATGWLPHSSRAALTGLRKKGHNLEKSKRGDVSCYRIVDAA